MRQRGHEILITASKKEMTLDLLKTYGLDYIFTCKRYRGVGLAYELVKRDAQMFRIAMAFKPDVVTGIHSTIAAHISKVTRAKSVVFTDSELGWIANLATFPFADVICAPSCFKIDLGHKLVRYNGYHELAYLHPHHFRPDPSVLDDVGLKPNDRFAVVRFVAWGALHDIGESGFDIAAKRKLIEHLEEYAKVIVTSEDPLPGELEKYRITAPPERIHDLLYYATMLIGDGATMSSEAAVLGTPSIRHSSFVGPRDLGYLGELEQEYGMIYSFREPEQVIQKVIELVQQQDLNQEWARKRERLLRSKIDVTQFMVEFVENYPESHHGYQKEHES